MDIIEAIRRRHPEYVSLRRDLHAHPELAFDERRTSDIVAERLQRLDIEVFRGLAQTGVVGKLSAGSGSRALGLRADMDALPLTELNTFSHHSRHPGRMHACGHDGHTAMLLAAAEYLAVTREFDGTVYFIFQPAEEGDGGGRVMVEEGLFERFPMESVFGMHNWPGIPAGKFGVMSGPVMACADQFDIAVAGHGAHAAMPHQGVDPIVVGSALIQALQGIRSRGLDPLEPAVLSVTQFHAGDAYNIIPGEALLRGTVRAFSPHVQDAIEAAIGRICNGIAAGFGADIRFDYRRGYPPTINSADEAELCRQVAALVVGQDNVLTDLAPTMGAEDFSYMLQAKPGCYVWIGNGTGEGGCMLHNPRFDFNDEILPIGATYWVRLAERVLANA
jgi:hippurate hydrolase